MACNEHTDTIAYHCDNPDHDHFWFSENWPLERAPARWTERESPDMRPGFYIRLWLDDNLFSRTVVLEPGEDIGMLTRRARGVERDLEQMRDEHVQDRQVVH